MKTVNIAIIGLGTVGQGTYKILEKNKELIKKRIGKEIRISKIYDRSFDKKYEMLEIDPAVKADTPDQIFQDENIEIVVEAIGGIEPATEYMLKAMNSGKSVVTPNKAAVAANYDKLLKTASENDVELRVEACVGGGIPALTSITEALCANEFTEVLGIVNGTTNYIMTKMTDEGLSYDDVLKDAQEKGFAEADPTADVEGIDAANKLSILMKLAFDRYVHPGDIPTEGITGITPKDIEAAKQEGCKIKLIAEAKKEGENIKYSVGPVKLPQDHPLAGVSNEFNAIYLTGNAVGEVMFYGKGAGSLPTGSAVCGDIIAIAKK